MRKDIVQHNVVVDGITYCATSDVASYTVLGFGERITSTGEVVRFIELDFMPSDEYGRRSLKPGQRIRISVLDESNDA